MNLVETKKQNVRRSDVIFPELSYQIVGAAFNVYNELGRGHVERDYERALEVAFWQKGLRFKKQVYFSLKFQGKTIGKRFLDFLVENKVVVELKKGDRFSKVHIDQVLEYLGLSNFKLAILINFGKEGVSFKRIVNFS